MTASALSAFTLVALVAVLTPGLDTMTVLRNVVTSGRRGGLAAGLGVSAGCLVWGVASIAGLTALLTASRIAHTAVHFAGAAYLARVRVRRWLDRITATILIGIGVSVAVETG